MSNISVSAKSFSDEIERVKKIMKEYENNKDLDSPNYNYWVGRFDTLMWISRLVE